MIPGAKGYTMYAGMQLDDFGTRYLSLKTKEKSYGKKLWNACAAVGGIVGSVKNMGFTCLFVSERCLAQI